MCTGDAVKRSDLCRNSLTVLTASKLALLLRVYHAQNVEDAVAMGFRETKTFDEGVFHVQQERVQYGRWVQNSYIVLHVDKFSKVEDLGLLFAHQEHTEAVFTVFLQDAPPGYVAGCVVNQPAVT